MGVKVFSCCSSPIQRSFSLTMWSTVKFLESWVLGKRLCTLSTPLAIKFNDNNILLLRPSSGYLGGPSTETLLSLNLIASAEDSVQESFAGFCQPSDFSYTPVDVKVCKSCTLWILHLEIAVLDATLSDGDGRLPLKNSCEFGTKKAGIVCSLP